MTPRPRAAALVPLTLFLAVVSLAVGASAQERRALSHDDYDQWKSIRATAYSQDGEWVAYQIEPQFGDGVLEVRQTRGDVVHRQPLGSGPRFSADGRFLVFTKNKSKVEERQKKIDELRKKASAGAASETTSANPTEERPAAGQEPPAGARRGGGAMPGGARGGGAVPGGRRGAPGGAGGGAPAADDTSRERGELIVLDLQTGKLESLGRAKGFTLPDDVAILLYHLDRPETASNAPTRPAAESAAPGAPGAEPAAEPAAPAAPVPTEPAAAEPAKGETTGSAAAAEARPGTPARGEGRRPTPPPDPLERKRQDGTVLVLRDLASGHERRIEDVVSYGVSRKGKWLWYHTSAKKPKPEQQYGLFAMALHTAAMPTQLLDGAVNFSNVTIDRNESAIAFCSDKADFAADKPRLDVYLWDGGIGAARLILDATTPGLPAGKQFTGRLSFSRDGTVLECAVQDPPEPELPAILPEEKVTLDLWNWRDGTLQPAQQRRGAGERNPALTAVWHRDQERLLVLGDERLRQLRFLGPDGARMLGTDGRPYDKLTTWDGRYQDVWLVNTIDGARTKVLEKLRGNVSNSPGGRFLLWFTTDGHWWTHDIATGQKRNLTADLGVAFHREDDDHPEPDPAHGVAGWVRGDEAVLLYDEFDLWKVSPTTGAAVCVTDGFGRANRLRLRVQQLPRDDDDEDGVGYLPNELLLAATHVDTKAEGLFTDSLVSLQKPQKLVLLDRKIGGLTKAKKADRFFFTLQTFHEFPDLWTAGKDLADRKRLTDVNPQQKDYRWGRSELVQWINGDGVSLQGVLVKPDGFDPNKKYPMLVYFYERSSQNLHNYVAPTPGTSPNAAYYVSNGYLFFMPDIVYQEGYPGESCVKCVVAGVQHLLAQGFVDPKGIGAAGHSWGGYQTAFLVTRTNIFAAVESGAPVSNMFSAYGGIRYESGVSRQFQYEMTQSRIGGTPWQYPMRYWENSPIFFADKVRTPVLILHNDQDGAVPWTNGIEYFTALRRLDKECYLFNYNGEGHGLSKRPNQKDWSRRMSEYFAHHLKGEPAPKWMTEGVPFHERDKEKLPTTPSYIEAYVLPKQQPVVPAPAETAPAAAPASASGPAAVPAEAAAPAPAGAGAESGNGSSNGSSDAGAARPARGRRAVAAGEEPAPKLAPGQAAPDFGVQDQDGTLRKLADYRGQHVVIWFYPKADTPGCTAQACGLRDRSEDLRAAKIAVLGVSFDEPAANQAFRQKHGLPFPLLSDTERSMALAYGAADDAAAPMARRTAALIDPDGKVVRQWQRVDPRTFADLVLRELSATAK